MTGRTVRIDGWSLRAAARSGLAALLIASASSPCLPGLPLEYEVKSGYLYNFARFVEWPRADGTEQAIVVGIVGQGPVSKALRDSLNGTTLGQRTISARILDPAAEIPSLHMLFVPNDFSAYVPRILRQVKGRAILTVGESDPFLAQGGMVAFYVDENRVHFAVNLPAAERAGLKISSQMLQFARVVNN